MPKTLFAVKRSLKRHGACFTDELEFYRPLSGERIDLAFFDGKGRPPGILAGLCAEDEFHIVAVDRQEPRTLPEVDWGTFVEVRRFAIVTNTV